MAAHGRRSRRSSRPTTLKVLGSPRRESRSGRDSECECERCGAPRLDRTAASKQRPLQSPVRVTKAIGAAKAILARSARPAYWHGRRRHAAELTKPTALFGSDV